MKRLIILSALSAFVFFSCRKETPRELGDGFVESELTCDNGIMDENEDGIDCGTAVCIPCLLSHPLCSGELTDNHVTAGGSGTTYLPVEVSSSTASGKLVITANNGTLIRVTFSSATPEVFRSYECVQSSNPDSESVLLQYNDDGNLYSAYSSEVHLNRENGKYTIEVCDAYMNAPSAPYMIFEGKLVSGN